MKPPRPEVIHHDTHTLLAAKPPGMVVESPSSPLELSLQSFIRRNFPTARAVHRIDKDTSGLVLWALTDEAYRYYSELFARRGIEKTYHAVVCGPASEAEQTINLPIVRTGSGKGRVSHRYGKPARTHVRVLENFRHFTLMECCPLTGRFHQIRIHLAAVGHPIAADPIYGGCIPLLSELKPNYRAKKDREEPPMIRRTALHAAALRFIPYGETTPRTFTAPYPKDFEKFLRQLRKYDASSPL